MKMERPTRKRHKKRACGARIGGYNDMPVPVRNTPRDAKFEASGALKAKIRGKNRVKRRFSKARGCRSKVCSLRRRSLGRHLPLGHLPGTAKEEKESKSRPWKAPAESDHGEIQQLWRPDSFLQHQFFLLSELLKATSL